MDHIFLEIEDPEWGSSCLGGLEIYLSVAGCLFRLLASVNVSSVNATHATCTFALSTAVLVCGFFYFSFTPKLTPHVLCILCVLFFTFLYSSNIETGQRTRQSQSGHATVCQKRIVQITVFTDQGSLRWCRVGCYM